MSTDPKVEIGVRYLLTVVGNVVFEALEQSVEGPLSDNARKWAEEYLPSKILLAIANAGWSLVFEQEEEEADD